MEGSVLTYFLDSVLGLFFKFFFSMVEGKCTICFSGIHRFPKVRVEEDRILVSWGLEGVVCTMASPPSAEEMLSLRHGFRCVPEIGVKVEEVLRSVGEQVGAGIIHSASRMSKARLCS